MALKVNARIVGYGPDPSRTTALVAVIIEFGGPQETMEIKLLVPNENDKDQPARPAGEMAPCQAIQTIIDKLTETKSNTELRLLSQSLQRLALHAAPRSRDG